MLKVKVNLQVYDLQNVCCWILVLRCLVKLGLPNCLPYNYIFFSFTEFKPSYMPTDVGLSWQHFSVNLQNKKLYKA